MSSSKCTYRREYLYELHFSFSAIVLQFYSSKLLKNGANVDLKNVSSLWVSEWVSEWVSVFLECPSLYHDLPSNIVSFQMAFSFYSTSYPTDDFHCVAEKQRVATEMQAMWYNFSSDKKSDWEWSQSTWKVQTRYKTV